MKNYPYLDAAIANVLRQRRAALNMSKKKLSDTSSIARVHISHLEDGLKKPSVHTLFCLCDAMELDPKDFIQMVQEEIRRLQENETPKA